MRVIFIKTPVVYGMAYFVEDVAEIPDNKAKELMAKGVVVKVTETFTPLAKSIKFRPSLIEAGFYSMETLATADRNDVITVGNDIISVLEIYSKWKANNFLKSL